MKTSDITDPLFRNAVEAIDSGNISLLQQLLQKSPLLVTNPTDTPTEGYFANPYLIWFVAGNPVRNKKLPKNIVDITRIVIEALQKNSVGNYQYQVDYTLGLICTGRIPKECGAQIPLMELLIKEGANVNKSVLGIIGQHNFEAAELLVEKGSDYDLATAVGLNHMDEVEKMVNNATASALYVALVVASFFGKDDIISLLIEAGADVNGVVEQNDFGGFHSHASALHQAVSSGSLKSVKILVKADSNLDATDKMYNGTPLDWAMHMQAEENDESIKKKYREIENYLTDKMNK